MILNFKYDMNYLPEFISGKRFREEVELWRFHGDINVVEVLFTDVGNEIVLIVPDFKNPDRLYSITYSESLK